MRPPRIPGDIGAQTRAVRRTRNLERRFARPRTLIVVIDGMGAVITEGVAGDAAIHFDCVITGWRLLADQPGDIVIDIWKTDYDGYPPTIADTITAAAQPTLIADEKANDTTLDGWTTEVAAGDNFRFNVDTVADIERVTLTLALIA